MAPKITNHAPLDRPCRRAGGVLDAFDDEEVATDVHDHANLVVQVDVLVPCVLCVCMCVYVWYRGKEWDGTGGQQQQVSVCKCIVSSIHTHMRRYRSTHLHEARQRELEAPVADAGVDPAEVHARALRLYLILCFVVVGVVVNGVGGHVRSFAKIGGCIHIIYIHDNTTLPPPLTRQFC